MVVYLYQGGQRKPLLDPNVYVGPAKVPVQTIHAYTGGQRSLVWARAPLQLSATAVSPSQIDLSWTAVTALGPGVSYRLYRTAGPGGTGQLPNGATALSYSDTGLTAGSLYSYRIDAVYGGSVWGSGEASATTSPQLYEPKTVTLDADYKAAYKEDGTKNTWNGASSTKFMSGRFDGTNGLQRSGFHFPVPADVRTCEYIESIEFSVQNDHWANGSGAVQYLAITHTPLGGDAWARWPGATGAFGGRYTYLDRWYGGAQSTTTRHWVNITNDKEPTYNDTVAGNFRHRGAQGICLVQTSTAQSAYGYFHGNAQLRIKYVVKK